MTPLTCLVVDDEPLGRQALLDVLREFKEFEVVGEAGDGFEAVRLCRRLRPDVMFLDIEMPRLNGFDVLELLTEDLPRVVFVTAYDHFAVRAFETRALDYVLKPVSVKRLAATLSRLLEADGEGARGRQLSALMDEHRSSQTPLRRILIQNRGEVTIIPCEEVVFIQAQGDYVRIHTESARFMKLERLARLADALDPAVFVRVHRSHIINVNHLRKIEPYSKDDHVARLITGARVPVSRSGMTSLMNVLEGRER